MKYIICEDETMDTVYIEENGVYMLDCRAAVWSTNQIHEHYAQYVIGSFLNDVDFVIETNEYLILVEYKNANIPGAANPERFRPESDAKLENVAKKYFDSLHYLFLLGKDKPKRFIYIVEYPRGDSASRKMLRNKLKVRLPFRMQTAVSEDRHLIEDVQVLNIQEWNADELLGRFPISPVEGT